MKKLYLLGLILMGLNMLNAQKAKVYGVVTDEKGLPMYGVTVAIKGTSTGTLTDTAGKYSLPFEDGTRYVDFTFIGYSPRSILVTIIDQKDKSVDVQMTDSTKELEIVVVTGTKYEKKLGEQITSMEVVKATAILANNATMDEAMNLVPGVNMMGRTISIRGGSGFSDVTSNRVLALMDNAPIVSPENGGIIWDMIPIEELEQVEIQKGSSSSLFGSAALDGVMNSITVSPSPTMENRVTLDYGFYGQPDDKGWDYWWHRDIQKKDGQVVNRLVRPMFGGGTFLHRKQYGDFGVVLSGAYRQNQNYLQGAALNMVRFGGKVRYTPHKNPHITLGLNANFFYKIFQDFFVAKNIDSGAYQALVTPNPNVVQRTFLIDPYLNYYDDNGNEHKFKFQVFNALYYSNNGDSSASTKYYYNYTYIHKFKKSDVILTAGTEGFYTMIRSKTFGPVLVNPQEYTVFGTRDEMNYAAFAQFEKKFFHRLTIAGGLRMEYAQLSGQTVENQLPLINMLSKAFGDKNTISSPVTPLARVGINYQVTEGTFIRGSIGQGFRYASMSEKYSFTQRSGVDVFPNDTLKPENGWMAEIGIKQGVKISKWMAYFDVCGFIMRYHDLIEFEQDNALPDSIKYSPYLLGINFQAQNIDNARIPGVEFSALGNGKIFGVPLSFLIGYTYIYPQNMSYDPGVIGSTPLLKYRIQNTAKADIQSNYKGLTVGISGFYGSYMKYIDNGTVGALQVVNEFRATHDKGELVVDIRAGYTYKEKASFMFICKNVANTVYMLQPGVIDAPRNYGFQVGYNF